MEKKELGSRVESDKRRCCSGGDLGMNGKFKGEFHNSV